MIDTPENDQQMIETTVTRIDGLRFGFSDYDRTGYYFNYESDHVHIFADVPFKSSVLCVFFFQV